MDSSHADRVSKKEWCKKGIVGRGVLFDFVSYAERHGIEYDCTGHYAISLEVLKEIAVESNIRVRSGDVLLVRTGMCWRPWLSFPGMFWLTGLYGNRIH